MATGYTWLRMWFDAHRGLFGKFIFEIVIVFVGVTAAFALEEMHQNAEESRYRASVIAALGPTLDDVVRHDAMFENDVTEKLKAFDAEIARGEHPSLPIFREANSERPPTRVWDAIVATGAVRSIDPALFFRLALFYTRQESFGERYVRYNDFTESRVLALGPDPSKMYDPASARLKPEFAAHVDRLRDLVSLSATISAQAKELREALENLSAPAGAGRAR